MEKNCESCRYTNQARWDTPCRNCVGYIAWKGQELTEYAKDAQSELAELRAFKAACEGQAAAAYVVKDDEGEQLMYPGAIFKYRMASEDDIVADLFTHPDPEAAQLRMRVKELEDGMADYYAMIQNQDSKAIEELHSEITQLEAKLEMANACLAADGALITGLKEELAKAKTVPMKYKRMAFNAELQDENTRLRQQVAARTEQRDLAVEALNEINNWLVCACITTPEDMAQSFGHMQAVAEEALTASQSSEVIA